MKLKLMISGTLALMIAFAAISYLFTEKQLISMQKKIDTSWNKIEVLLAQKKQTNSDNQLDVAGTQYNRLVENYNASIKRFPGSFIAEKNDMQARVYFLPEEEKENTN